MDQRVGNIETMYGENGVEQLNETCTSELNETSDESLLNMENSDEFVQQSNSLQSDIDTGLFEINFQPGKRSSENKQLKDELFDFSIYKQKQCGFLTSRPLFWIQAIDKYVESNDNTVGKFRYKTMKNSNKYHVVMINICYQITKKIIILINLITGVVLVKGEHYANWIQDEFSKICPQVSTPANHNDVITPKIAKNCNNNIEKEFEALWRHSSANKTSLSNIDGTQKLLRDEFDEHVCAHSTRKVDIAHLNNEIQNSDGKMTLFLKTTTEECMKFAKTKFIKADRKIQDIQEKVGEFKVNLTRRVDEFIANHNTVTQNVTILRKLTTEIEKQKKERKEVINEYKMLTNKNTEGIKVAQGKSETKAMEEVETIKKDLRSQRKEITNLADNELKIELKKEEEDIAIRITDIKLL